MNRLALTLLILGGVLFASAVIYAAFTINVAFGWGIAGVMLLVVGLLITLYEANNS